MSENVSTAERKNIFFPDFPFEGIGKRYMSCDMYDECLHKAAVNDWHSLHCEGCIHEEQQMLDFFDDGFIPDEDLKELIFGDNQGVEQADLSFVLPLTCVRQR